MSFFCMLEAQPTTTFAQPGENDKRSHDPPFVEVEGES